MSDDELPFTAKYNAFIDAADRITVLPLLRGLREILAKLERSAIEKDPYANGAMKKLESYFKNLTEDNIDSQGGFFTTLAEARIFLELKRRGVLIERVAETSTPTPDFAIDFGANRIFAEIKAPLIADAIANYKKTAWEGVAARGELEANGRSIQVMQPFFDSRKDGYDPSKVTFGIDILIKKIRNLVKLDQLKQGKSIFIIDLTQWVLGRDVRESLMPTFYQSPHLGYEKGYCCSGILWHVAFGIEGSQIFCTPDPVTGSNFDERLKENGILIEFPAIEALLFRIDSNELNLQYAALCRKDTDENVISILHQCNAVINDELNSNASNLQPVPSIRWGFPLPELEE